MTFRLDERYFETRLVHEGHQRTPFGETSEALFLTQGFVYDSAESAERRFLNEDPDYRYSRYSNPTWTPSSIGTICSWTWPESLPPSEGSFLV